MYFMIGNQDRAHFRNVSKGYNEKFKCFLIINIISFSIPLLINKIFTS